MPGFLSEYSANKFLDQLYGATVWTPPVTLYCALFIVAPTAGGGGTEISGTGYVRVAVTNNTTNFLAAVGQIKRNATAITFPTPAADWAPAGTPCVGAAWFDAASGGDMLQYGPFTTPRVILLGDAPPSILANGGTFTFV